jgi:hypothetical protein
VSLNIARRIAGPREISELYIKEETIMGNQDSSWRGHGPLIEEEAKKIRKDQLKDGPLIEEEAKKIRKDQLKDVIKLIQRLESVLANGSEEELYAEKHRNDQPWFKPDRRETLPELKEDLRIRIQNAKSRYWLGTGKVWGDTNDRNMYMVSL